MNYRITVIVVVQHYYHHKRYNHHFQRYIIIIIIFIVIIINIIIVLLLIIIIIIIIIVIMIIIFIIAIRPEECNLTSARKTRWRRRKSNCMNLRNFNILEYSRKLKKIDLLSKAGSGQGVGNKVFVFLVAMLKSPLSQKVPASRSFNFQRKTKKLICKQRQGGQQ